MSILTRRQFTKQCEHAQLITRNKDITVDIVMVRRKKQPPCIAVIGHMIPWAAAEVWRKQGWQIRTICRYYRGEKHEP